MERRTFISSSSNPRLKKIRRLRRRDDRAFLVEGFRQVECALQAGVRVRELLVAPDLWLGTSEAEVARAAALGGAEVLELGAAAFTSISGHIRPDGVAAVVECWPTALERLALPADPLVLVAEAVERPGNLGMIVRSACAAGAAALVAADPRTDLFHPASVRGSVGAVFKLPLGQGTTEDVIAWLRASALPIVVATPGAERSCWAADLAGPAAIVVGNERYGVSRAWLDAADETVIVPMPGPADSLNVAVAAGVILFEAARQRAHTESLQRSA
jgi:RNA methyltransferase, TrmH family